MSRRRKPKHYSLQRGRAPMWKGYRAPAPFSRDPRQLGLFDAAAPATPPVAPMREPQPIDLEAFIASLPKDN